MNRAGSRPGAAAPSAKRPAPGAWLVDIIAIVVMSVTGCGDDRPANRSTVWAPAAEALHRRRPGRRARRVARRALELSSPNVRSIMSARLDLAAEKGCKPVFNAEYVDPDSPVEAERQRDELCAAARAAGTTTLILPLDLDDSYHIACPPPG